MERFFDLNNNIALKYQEIQYKFIDGIFYLLDNYKDSVDRGNGLEKLFNLKLSYEQQLKEYSSDPDMVKDISVCFRCFDKPDGPCVECG